MKAIAGPRATGGQFGFRADAATKYVFDRHDPQPVKREHEALAKHYADDGFLEIVGPRAGAAKKKQEPPSGGEA